MEVNGEFHDPTTLSQEEERSGWHWKGPWVGPGADLKAVLAMRKITFLPSVELRPSSPKLTYWRGFPYKSEIKWK